MHRIGQTLTAFATYIHAPASLDEPVAALLEEEAAVIATMEDAARDHASIVDAAVARAVGGWATGEAADPAVPPRPMIGLREGVLDLLATLIGKDLSAHTGDDVIEFERDSQPGVVYTVRLVAGVVACDCRGFKLTGHSKHVRNVLRRGGQRSRWDQPPDPDDGGRD